MLERIPDETELTALLGEPLYQIWTRVNAMIEEKYDMECLWNSGGKAWDYEYKYRRGGKTLCALYARKNCVGLMIIFGQAERDKFEERRFLLSPKAREIYDEAQTYRDGKWVMFLPENEEMFEDFMTMLEIKRKPNRVYPCGHPDNLCPPGRRILCEKV